MLRARLLALIEREQRRAEAGQPARIRAKMNSLVDVDIVRALYRASQAGVRIELNVRGICIAPARREGPEREHHGARRSSGATSSTRASSSSTTAATRRCIWRAPTGCRATSIARVELMFPVRVAALPAQGARRARRAVPRQREGPAAGSRTASGRCRRAGAAPSRSPRSCSFWNRRHVPLRPSRGPRSSRAALPRSDALETAGRKRRPA